MRLNLKQLEAFVWVADLQSFRRAADRLNTTQPNISARIANLEATLDTKLMTRDAGSVRLTGKGQELLSYARQVLHATDDFIAVSQQKHLIEGTLRLGVTEMIVHTWLRDYLRALKDQFPNLAVELTVDFSVNLEKGLGERTLDLALQNEPFSRLTAGQIDIGAYDLIWLAAPSLNLSNAVTIEELASHPILTHARDTRLYEAMGVAALPAAMVTRELASGSLIQLPYAWAPAPLHFFARFDAGRAPRIVTDAAKAAVKTAQAYNQNK